MIRGLCRREVLILLALTSHAAQLHFPDWRGSPVLLPTVWAKSTIAAVGEVISIAPYGEQAVSGLPIRGGEGIRRLYWCHGEFRATAIVKGTLPDPVEKYLWADTRPGCRLWDDDPALVFSRFKTRVWLLREEAGYLRPTFDGGAQKFIGLFPSWDDLPSVPPKQRLGIFLLTPLANSDNSDDYATYLWNVGDVACDLLGNTECVEQFQQLASQPNGSLRTSACNFLSGQLGKQCSP